MAEGEKKEVKGIGGWLSLFVFMLFASIFLHLVLAIIDIGAIIEETTLTGPYLYGFLFFNILFYLFIIIFAIITIYAFLKLKANAVSLGKMYLILIFLTNLIVVAFSILIGEPIDAQASYFDNSITIFRSMLFSVIWFLYLTYSKRVKNTYPIDERKTYTKDKILFAVILAIPIVMYSLSLIGNAYLIAEGNAMTELEVERELQENEYSDGYIFFMKPDKLDIQEEVIDSVKVYTLSKDDNITINILSGVSYLNQQSYFNDVFDLAYSAVSEGYELDYSIVEETSDKTSNGFDYIKKTIKIGEGELALIWSVAIVFDSESKKTAEMAYMSFEEYDAENKPYFHWIIDSVKFS